MKVKKHFYLHSVDGNSYEKMKAEDLIRLGLPRSTAYRAIEKGTLPRHRLRELQLKIFGDLPGWEGWKILSGLIVSPSGQQFDHIDLENLAYLRKELWREYGRPRKSRNIEQYRFK